MPRKRVAEGPTTDLYRSLFSAIRQRGERRYLPFTLEEQAAFREAANCSEEELSAAVELGRSLGDFIVVESDIYQVTSVGSAVMRWFVPVNEEREFNLDEVLQQIAVPAVVVIAALRRIQLQGDIKRINSYRWRTQRKYGKFQGKEKNGIVWIMIGRGNPKQIARIRRKSARQKPIVGEEGTEEYAEHLYTPPRTPRIQKV